MKSLSKDMMVAKKVQRANNFKDFFKITDMRVNNFSHH